MLLISRIFSLLALVVLIAGAIMKIVYKQAPHNYIWIAGACVVIGGVFRLYNFIFGKKKPG